MTYVLTILLCLPGTAPDRCTPVTAVETYSRPATAIECVAPSSMVADSDERDHGLIRVVRCERRPS